MDTVSNDNPIDTNRLTTLRDKIEKFEKNQQIQILKILKDNKIPINENAIFIFIYRNFIVF